MLMSLTRRSFVAGATLGSASLFIRSLRAADYTFTQFHNQPATSSLHQRLVQMWAAIRTETRGRVDTQVLAENNRIQGSDPAALKMLIDGEIQFFTLMGGILGTVVPAAEVQQVPFAFRSAAARAPGDGRRAWRLSARGNGGEGDRRLSGRRLRQRDAPDRRHEAPDRGSRRSRRHQDAGPGRATGGRHVQSARRGTGHHQQQRDLRRAEERHGRRAGEPARARRSVQAVRGREVRQHDEPHVVGLQPAGAPADLETPSRGHQSGHRAQRDEVRAPPAA